MIAFHACHNRVAQAPRGPFDAAFPERRASFSSLVPSTLHQVLHPIALQIIARSVCAPVESRSTMHRLVKSGSKDAATRLPSRWPDPNNDNGSGHGHRDGRVPADLRASEASVNSKSCCCRRVGVREGEAGRLDRTTYITVTASLFLLLAIAHLLRIILGWQVEIGG